MPDMISSVVSLKVLDSPDVAPKYGAEVGLLKISEVLVVKRGTVNGNPTVDIQLKDAQGKDFLIMATGGIIEMIGRAAEAARIQSKTN